MINRLKNQFEEACNLFIRPPKHDYELDELGVNPLKIKNNVVVREDLILKNPDNKALYCSFYRIKDESVEPRPCMVYLHCNAGSRCEVLPVLSYLITIGINVFSFDMSGCGMSEGEYVTLGFKECLDVKTVVEHLIQNNKVSSVGLWGRSMGAVTALKYAEIDPKLSVLIIDSPFSSLNKLAHELAKEKTGIPNILLPMALCVVKKGIKQKVHLKFSALDLTKIVPGLKTPACFLFSFHDEIIKPYHVEKLFELYGCPEKKLISIKGKHNDPRPPSILRELGKFCFDHFIKYDPSFKKKMSRYETLDLYSKYAILDRQEKSPLENGMQLLKDLSSNEDVKKQTSIELISKNELLFKNDKKIGIKDWELPLVDEDLPSIMSNVSLLSQNEVKFLMKESLLDFNNTSATSHVISRGEVEIQKKVLITELDSSEKWMNNPQLCCKPRLSGISPIHLNKERIESGDQYIKESEKSFHIKVFMN